MSHQDLLERKEREIRMLRALLDEARAAAVARFAELAFTKGELKRVRLQLERQNNGD